MSFTTGVINGTAPNPVRLAEMCEQLGSVIGRPSWLPVPDIALKALLGEGATVVYLLFLGTFCYLPLYLSFYIHAFHSLHSCGGSTPTYQVLEGQKVLPTRAKELGFPFKYRYVRDALKAIMS